MKCTECNKELKPVVAIDIDGTLGMYHQHFLRFAADYLNKRLMDHYVGHQPFKEWFCTNYNVSTDVWHDIKLAYRQGGLKRTMPVYTGAFDLCLNTRLEGAELWVTTTRPYIRHDNIDPDTRHWLDRNRIGYDYLIYDGHKYEKLAQLVGQDRVCAVLDDLEDECLSADKIFGHEVPILRHTSFNGAFRFPVRATNLQMARHLIKQRIIDWKEKHDDHKNEPIPYDGSGHSAESSQQVPEEGS